MRSCTGAKRTSSLGRSTCVATSATSRSWQPSLRGDTPTTPAAIDSDLIHSWGPCRGMSRGTNHRTPETLVDTSSEAQGQVGRLRSPESSRLTGLRRRGRRFESCRGHQTCFFHTSGHKITAGFLITSERPDRHVRRAVPSDALGARRQGASELGARRQGASEPTSHRPRHATGRRPSSLTT